MIDIALMKQDMQAFVDEGALESFTSPKIILELISLLEQAQKDAARYQFLKENHVRKWMSDMDYSKTLDLDFEADGHNLDSAIDAAMQSEKGG